MEPGDYAATFTGNVIGVDWQVYRRYTAEEREERPFAQEPGHDDLFIATGHALTRRGARKQARKAIEDDIAGVDCDAPEIISGDELVREGA